MITRPLANSPKYQRLPFTHNSVQASLTLTNNKQKPQVKFNSPTQPTIIKPQIDTTKYPNLQFMRKKPTSEDANLNVYSNNKHHEHNASYRADIVEKFSNQFKKVSSLGQDENFKNTQITPNSKSKDSLLNSKSTQISKLMKTPSPNIHIKPYHSGLYSNQFKSLQTTSQKLTSHHPTGSYNYTTLQQQITNLIRKTEGMQTTPGKYNTEHSKSRSVVDQKENDFKLSNQAPLNHQLRSPQTQQFITSVPQEYMRCQHKEKKAKYVNTSDGSHCCSDCALKLANQGFKFLDVEQGQLNANNQFVSDQYYKEFEMRSFLTQLENNQLQREKLPDIMQSQLQQITKYYEGQIYQNQNIHSKLQASLHQAYQTTQKEITAQMTKSVQIIQTLFQEFNASLADTSQIQKDIQTNWMGIVEGIEILPFKEIMSQYMGKFYNTSKQIENIMSKNVVIVSLPPADIYGINRLISERFELIYQTIPLIPQEFKSEKGEPFFGQPIRTQPTPQKKSQITPKSIRIKTDLSDTLTQQSNTETIPYIKSKSLTQKNKSIEPDPKSNVNFFQHFFQQQPIINESLESCRAVTSNSLHNQVYISFENRDIFHNAIDKHIKEEEIPQNAIMILQSYRGSQQVSDDEDSHSTPHSPASGNPKSQYERVGVTPKIVQQPDTQEKQTFRTLFENQQGEGEEYAYKKTSNKVSSVNSDKFKSFLDRVKYNQNKTQKFYSNFVQSKTQSSPRYDQMSFDDNERHIEIIQSSELQSNDMLSSLKKLRSVKKREISVPSESSQSSEQVFKVRDPFQKTLFCSPTFKTDVINSQ